MFVLVTMSLSAVSVIVSIFSVRVNSITSPLPAAVRAVAFGCLARILCVSVPDSPQPTAVLDDHHDITANSTARVVYVPADRTSTIRSASRPHLSVNSIHADSNCARSPPTDCSCQHELKTQVGKLLHELRKVFACFELL